MPAKGKHVHTTRSVTARERSNSPLQVKVQNNLARTKPKERNKQPLKSVIKEVNNKQAKGKSVSFSDQDSASLASQPPKQTAFADAMEKWKRSVVDAINSVPTPCVGNQMLQVHTLASHSQIFKQATAMILQWDGPLQLEANDNPILVALGNSDDGLGGGGTPQFGVDATQPFPSGNVGQDTNCDEQAMELDQEDNPLPPPRGCPTDAPVAAASAPKGALQLMAVGARQSQGKQPSFILAKHVPDNIKRRIWANKYVDFHYLVESDPTEEVVYQFVASPNNAVTLKPAKPKSKLDGWATCLLRFIAWNTLTEVLSCSSIQAAWTT